jgi:basic amino acid/polyamine antiporter, APA family
MSNEAVLRKRLTLPYLVLYGLGTIVGAGIYVLVGKVAGRAGMLAPVSFILAAMLAAMAAAAYAEMSSRFPQTAAEAVYVRHGLRNIPLAILAGSCVLITGTVSAAALSVGFAGYFKALVDLPSHVIVIGVVVLLGAIAVWGIKESAIAAATITCVEVGGLLLVIWAGSDALATLPARLPEMVPSMDSLAWIGILAGIFLAFFAFIGFEDMVNVAEEVQDAPRTMPIAIVITMALSIVLYMAVTIVAVLSVPLDVLAASEAPLVEVFERGSGMSGASLTVIGSFAVINGALIQMIMASRVIHGMTRQGWLPAPLGRIHPRTGTPVTATLMVSVVVVSLALVADVETLAQFTTLFTLSAFSLVNASLWVLKGRHPEPPPSGFCLPRWLPGLGAVVSLIFAVLTALDLAGRLTS